MICNICKRAADNHEDMDHPFEGRIQFTEKSVYDAMAKLGCSIESDSLVSLAEALLRVANEKQAARNSMGTLIERMQRAVEHLDFGWTVNSLGEVQSSGPEVDRHCALFDAAIREYKRLRWLLVRTEAVVESVVVEFEVNAGWKE